MVNAAGEAALTTIRHGNHMMTTTKRSQARNPARQGGWAMMETLIALIIGLVVLAGAFVLVQQAFSGNQVGNAREQLMTLNTNIKRMFNNQATYSGLSPTLAIDSGIAPQSMADAADKLANPWGGDVDLQPVDGGSSTDSHYLITLTNVPPEACIELGTFSRAEWVAVSVPGGGLSDDGSADADTGLSAGGGIAQNDIASAQTACNGAGDDEAVTMSFLNR